MVVVELGGILSDGVGHSLLHIYAVHTYMDTKALLNVFIILSCEMKILIWMQHVFCPPWRHYHSHFSLPYTCRTPPYTFHYTSANSPQREHFNHGGRSIYPTPSIRVLTHILSHSVTHSNTHPLGWQKASLDWSVITLPSIPTHTPPPTCFLCYHDDQENNFTDSV